MEKKKSSVSKLAVALVLLVLCSGVALGSSFALFTSTKNVSNKLTVASGLKANLYLTELKQDVLDEEGMIKEVNADLSTYSGYNSNSKKVDLSSMTTPLFAGNNIVPTMAGSAKLEINNSGDLAFNYQVTTTQKVSTQTGEDKSNDASLKDLISWTVSYDDKDLTVKKDTSQVITVSYTFSSEATNSASELVYELDLQVICTQVTK